MAERMKNVNVSSNPFHKAPLLPIYSIKTNSRNGDANCIKSAIALKKIVKRYLPPNARTKAYIIDPFVSSGSTVSVGLLLADFLFEIPIKKQAD